MKLYHMSWDIIDQCDQVEAGTADNSYQFFKENFGGNCLELFYGRNGVRMPAKPRAWSATIVVRAVGTDGTQHELIFHYKANAKMGIKELMDGVTQQWLSECDEVLPDTDCYSAIAYAECLASVKSNKKYAAHIALMTSV